MVAEWITKQNPYTYCLQKTQFRSEDTHGLKVKGWKKIFHKNENKRSKNCSSNTYTRQNRL